MIFFFHLMYLVTRYIVKNLRMSLNKCDVDVESNVGEIEAEISLSRSFFAGRNHACDMESRFEESTGNIRFFPPVYTQRYEAVSVLLKEQLRDGQVQKVVDFGCAELKFFMYLKQIPGLREILAVDIDEELMDRYACRAAPLAADFLSSKRSVPLDVSVMVGSVDEYDDCLKNTDAVVAIELIEHLYPPTLEKLPYNIFKLIKPRLAIFTTPNADFNELFPNMVGFRHTDHKFEWSRREFYNWAKAIVMDYPDYSLDMYGVGPGPEGTERLGCCSQMAVFQRRGQDSPEPHVGKAKKYKTVRTYSHPHYVDPRTFEEKVVDEVRYRLSKMEYYLSESEDWGGVTEVPLHEVCAWVENLSPSLDQLRHILTADGLTVKETNGQPCLVYTALGSTTNGCSDEDDGWAEDESEPGPPRAPECSGASVRTPTFRPSRSPRKRNFAEVAPTQRKHAARPHSSYVRKSPRKIAKSFSLDSCLENINCEPVEVQAFYLNLISGGLRRHSSKQGPNSPLVDSSSLERAADSGYPFSFSPHDTDLTPEQVDELVTENEMTSARSSSSEDSGSQDEAVGGGEARGARVPLFVEEPVVENGDVANNNRDGEGNNVEGAAGVEPDPNDNLVPIRFPHWLLNMGDLVPLPAVDLDEGLGDDSSSDCNHSMDQEDTESVGDRFKLDGTEGLGVSVAGDSGY